MATSTNSPKRVLSVFSLAMINIIAVDSLRTLPFSAEFGSHLIAYYLLIAVLFFIPVGMVTAELATTWPKNGGIYVWVREAFGAKWGFLVIWLQWVYNVVWYPAILATIAGILLYLFNPALMQNPWITISAVLVIFWFATIANFYGMQVSGWFSTLCALVGTVIPMLGIIGLGGWWMITNPDNLQISFSTDSLVPRIDSINDLVLLTTVMFGLMGLEMSSVHASEVKNPSKDYPAAIKYSAFVILFTLMFGSLAVAMVVPYEELNIVTGAAQAFSYFFDILGIPWMLPVTAIAVIIGALGTISAWVIGPTKGLLIAAQEDNLPRLFSHTNKKGVPVAILILQGIIVSILSLVYIFLPTIESAYLILTQLTVILAVLMYVLMFIAAIVLRYKFPEINRPYRIPGGKYGIWVVGLLGAISSGMAMLLGFLPPSQISISDPLTYKLMLIGGVVVFCLPAFFVHKRQSS